MEPTEDPRPRPAAGDDGSKLYSPWQSVLLGVFCSCLLPAHTEYAAFWPQPRGEHVPFGPHSSAVLHTITPAHVVAHVAVFPSPQHTWPAAQSSLPKHSK
jgi:hypothetical protein